MRPPGSVCGCVLRRSTELSGGQSAESEAASADRFTDADEDFSICPERHAAAYIQRSRRATTTIRSTDASGHSVSRDLSRADRYSNQCAAQLYAAALLCSARVRVLRCVTLLAGAR